MVVIPSDPKACAFADVCAAVSGGGCQQLCVNNPPGQGLRCECDQPGFTVDPNDATKCVGEFMPLISCTVMQ